jgi:tetratricopeptide (TPR) repeat protein
MQRTRVKRTVLLVTAGAIAYFIGFLSTSRPAPAQTPAAEVRFDIKVREDFFAGLAGDAERLARGMKICETVLASNPKDADALVWHGAGIYFQAGQAFRSGNQAKGMELWTRGMKEMQTAVELAPDDPGTRIPRGATLLAGSRFMPEAMAQPLLKDALGDYEHIYELQKPYFATIGTHPRGELLFGLAEGYSRFGNAEKAQLYFERIKSDLPNTLYAKRADLWLSTKSLPANQTGCVGCHVAK